MQLWHSIRLGENFEHFIETRTHAGVLLLQWPQSNPAAPALQSWYIDPAQHCSVAASYSSQVISEKKTIHRAAHQTSKHLNSPRRLTDKED